MVERKEQPVIATDRGTSAPSDFLVLCRPRQWTKNLLVAAAPFAAGVIGDMTTFIVVLAGIAAFSLVSSGMYAINDARDMAEDRVHPRKRERPVAAGRISPRTATIFGAFLVTAGLILALVAGNPAFAAIVAVYAVATLGYSIWLKHVALIDIAIIALGFLLRALSGGVLVDVPISAWFLIVTVFGALFIAAGKRYGERLELGDNGREHRAALDDYAPGFIEFLLGTSAAVVLLAYSLWAYEMQDGLDAISWAALSIGPFVLGILRYAQLIYLGRGGEPESLVLGDRGLQAIGAAWAATLMLAFYGAL